MVIAVWIHDDGHVRRVPLSTSAAVEQISTSLPEYARQGYTFSYACHHSGRVLAVGPAIDWWSGTDFVSAESYADWLKRVNEPHVVRITD